MFGIIGSGQNTWVKFVHNLLERGFSSGTPDFNFVSGLLDYYGTCAWLNSPEISNNIASMINCSHNYYHYYYYYVD